MQFSKKPKISFPLQNGISVNILTRHNYKIDERRSFIFIFSEYVGKVIFITILVVKTVGNYYQSTALSGKVMTYFYLHNKSLLNRVW